MTDDRIKFNPITNRHYIDGGLKGYLTRESAERALANYLKRIGEKK